MGNSFPGTACWFAAKYVADCHFLWSAIVYWFIVMTTVAVRGFSFAEYLIRRFFMTKTKKIILFVAIAAIIALMVFACVSGGSLNTVDCPDCEGGLIGEEVCETCGGEGTIRGSLWALLPPIIAIGLALITKEVYSSLFVGIVCGSILAANFSFTGTVDSIVEGGVISAVSDTAGIFAFLVILGVLVAMMNKAGGSAAFGRWAEKHIKTRVGAQIATFFLGVLIFIDDYFNCLTVGSVMRPVTDAHKISRQKLAYLIDATAAPVCMIAPISSWAAAVSSYADGTQYSGIELFIKAIPFNFYSLLTIVFIITLSALKFDFGTMRPFEFAARTKGELGDSNNKGEEAVFNPKAKVIDLILPIVFLIVSCVVALMYNGGFFNPESGNFRDFVMSFSDTDSTVALPWGSLLALVAIIIYLLVRRVINFKDIMECIPKGFIAMVPAILILTFATSLKNMTGLLGAKYFIGDVMASTAGALDRFLPAIIFLVACVLAFATGTSWGTFGILIPIVTSIFDPTNPLLFVGMSACLAGAVFGDHCSPISDTTIMSSAGAQCEHISHVSTQIPYAIYVGIASFVMFVFSGFVPNWYIALPIGIVLIIVSLIVTKIVAKKKYNGEI